MDTPEPQRYTEAECDALFDRLFPQGFAGPDVMAELAPEGWANSPLMRVAHPTVERVYKERLAFHDGMDSMFEGKEGYKPDPRPTLEEVRGEYEETPIEPRRELGDLMAKCLWHVFSDNREVTDVDGRCACIGSFRGAAGFLADRLNIELGVDDYDYVHFYMGTIDVAQRADFTPVYELIFKRLNAEGLDWHYYAPLPSEVRAREAGDATEGQDTDAGDDEAQEEDRPLPEMVVGYRRGYGRDPGGWEFLVGV